MTCVVHYAPEAMEQLAELEAYIEHTSGSARTAARYVEDVMAYCDGLEVFLSGEQYMTTFGRGCG